jgi:hypothetical protein
MANSFRGEVPLTIGGKTITLKFNAEALYEFEELLGNALTYYFIDENAKKKLGMSFLVKGLYAACAHYGDERPSLKTIMRWFDEEDFDYKEVLTAVVNGVTLAMNFKKGQKKKVEAESPTSAGAGPAAENSES